MPNQTGTNMKTEKQKLGKFYGILTQGDGLVKLFIDYGKDFDGRYIRYSFDLDCYAFGQFLRAVLRLPEYDVSECFKELYRDHDNEFIGEYLMLSRNEWVELDENNEPIPVAVEMPMFKYYNQ
jgi:hypothetical protein